MEEDVRKRNREETFTCKECNRVFDKTHEAAPDDGSSSFDDVGYCDKCFID